MSGNEEGLLCKRIGCGGTKYVPCGGTIRLRSVENCSCHISPPCSSCTEKRLYCDVCEWEEKNDKIVNDFIVQEKDNKWIFFEPRPLDNSKIDYRIKPHTHFSQLCEGVYPEGTTRSEIEDRVRGTFGGRFEHFGDGKFKYVAYTD